MLFYSFKILVSEGKYKNNLKNRESRKKKKKKRINKYIKKNKKKKEKNKQICLCYVLLQICFATKSYGFNKILKMKICVLEM